MRANARWLFAAEAAVELLIGHGCWLERGDFIGGFVDSGAGLSDGTTMAWIDWEGAVAALQGGRLPCSGSEAGLLRVAASFAGGGPVDLREVVCGLDAGNLVLVAAAVLHAGGYRSSVVSVGQGHGVGR